MKLLDAAVAAAAAALCRCGFLGSERSLVLELATLAAAHGNVVDGDVDVGENSSLVAAAHFFPLSGFE